MLRSYNLVHTFSPQNVNYYGLRTGSIAKTHTTHVRLWGLSQVDNRLPFPLCCLLFFGTQVCNLNFFAQGVKLVDKK
jgi:hypothetical protein